MTASLQLPNLSDESIFHELVLSVSNLSETNRRFARNYMLSCEKETYHLSFHDFYDSVIGPILAMAEDSSQFWRMFTFKPRHIVYKDASLSLNTKNANFRKSIHLWIVSHDLSYHLTYPIYNSSVIASPPISTIQLQHLSQNRNSFNSPAQKEIIRILTSRIV